MSATASRPPVAFRHALRRGRGSKQDRRRSSRAAVFCAGLLAALLSASTPARADTRSDAQDLFARGRELRLHGDCASAVPLFRRALDLYPTGLGSLRNFAECEESLGHLASAREAWLDLGRALLTNRDPKYTGWALDAEQGAERLRAAEPPAGDAGAGDAKELASGVTAAQPPPSPAPEAPEARHPEATRTVGWVALGVGGASLIGAGIALLVRQEALAELPLCASTQCPESARNTTQPIVDRGHAATTLADTLGTVGLVGVASGLVLLWVGRPHSTDAALVVSPTGLLAAGRF
jgi:hypothetical protein